MGIIIWIIFGAIAGWAASALTGSGGGLVWDIVVGIVGAVIGGWIMTTLGGSPVSGFNLYSLAVAIFGACVLIYVVRLVRK